MKWELAKISKIYYKSNGNFTLIWRAILKVCADSINIFNYVGFDKSDTPAEAEELATATTVVVVNVYFAFLLSLHSGSS